MREGAWESPMGSWRVRVSGVFWSFLGVGGGPGNEVAAGAWGGSGYLMMT